MQRALPLALPAGGEHAPEPLQLMLAAMSSALAYASIMPILVIMHCRSILPVGMRSKR